MRRNLSHGASHSPDTRSGTTQAAPAGADARPQRGGRLREFLEWRSLGVRFALSRAKRRAHGRGPGPIKCIAAL
jgi:hypothetical protein